MARRQSSSDLVKVQLTEMILSGALMPGTIIRENEIAERFGVSRTPVREAIRQIAASGLIALRPRQRSVVTHVRLSEVVQHFETMSVLESACAEFAALRQTSETMAEIRKWHEVCASHLQADDNKAYYIANERFHEAIYHAAGNAHLAAETIGMRNRMRVLRVPRTSQPGRMAESFKEHSTIVEALEAKNAAAAGQSMRNHVLIQGETLRIYIDRYEDMIADRLDRSAV